MIELPLTPYFFQKLGIYQEISDKDFVADKKLWEMESALLIWTVQHHRHLASTLPRQYIEDRLLEKNFPKKQVKDLVPKVMGNLCQRGYASPIERELKIGKEGVLTDITEVKRAPSIAIDSPTEIIFTQKGLLAGRVLKEISEGKEWKYKVFIFCIYLSLVVLFLKTIISPSFNWLIKIIIPILESFKCIL